MKIDDAFLALLCKALKTTLTVSQGDAVKLLYAECDAHGVSDVRQIAYVLATVYHECRFRSIKEIKAKEGTAVWEMQKKYWHTGYYGRGFSQLTWQRNYAKFSPIVGRDLVASPDDALIPDVGAKIIVHGMVTGMFTGKALKGYFTDTKTDWLNARRIVNGTFMADKVADAAKKIHPLLV